MPDLTECGQCKTRPNKKKGQIFMICSACGLVAYCSTACQTKAWPGHKSDCKLNRAAKNARDEAAKERGSSSSKCSSVSVLEDMGSIMAALNSMPQAQPQPQPRPQRYQEGHVYNACYYGQHEELQKILLQSGLDVNDTDPDTGMTAAYIAAQQGHAQCLSVLAKHNADLSKASKEGWAPIHVACARGRHACLEVLLLDNAVDANLRTADEYGDTPLIKASLNGQVKSMALLLDRGSDPNLANNYGATAAHKACQYGYSKSLQLLVKRGANLNIKDRDGNTSLDYARVYKHPECVDLLLASGRATGMPVEDLDLVSEAEKVCLSLSQPVLCP